MLITRSREPPGIVCEHRLTVDPDEDRVVGGKEDLGRGVPESLGSLACRRLREPERRDQVVQGNGARAGRQHLTHGGDGVAALGRRPRGSAP